METAEPRPEEGDFRVQAEGRGPEGGRGVGMRQERADAWDRVDDCMWKLEGDGPLSRWRDSNKD